MSNLVPSDPGNSLNPYSYPPNLTSLDTVVKLIDFNTEVLNYTTDCLLNFGTPEYSSLAELEQEMRELREMMESLKPENLLNYQNYGQYGQIDSGQY